MTIDRWVNMLFDWVRGAGFRAESPLDTEAARWYRAHASVFPLDRRRLSLPD